ncbi:MAG: hydroxymethylglutaryl-CoA lyase [Betaproteobacteria bacterium]|jgi:hydroxymethylglutaryl-CoA lyase
MNASTADVQICEVGPRDGLQSVKSIMSTEHKNLWINAMYEAGLREIEVGSFVSPKLLPQMADTDQVVKFSKNLLGLTVVALVPNLKGAQKAIESGAHQITIPVSASAAHSWANVRKTPAEMVEEVKRIIEYRNAYAPKVKIEASISTAFGCTIEGLVPEDDVIQLALQVIQAGADLSGLSDTTGYANPSQVKRLFRRLKLELGTHAGAAHFHNTRGLGIANCLAAFEEGVLSFDSSMGGLGGCPYAPGASGNVVTEDLIFMFEAMGVSTGINLERLFQSRHFLSRGIPTEAIYGMVPEAGLPKGFMQFNQ